MPVFRLEIHPRPDQADPRGEQIRRSAGPALGFEPKSVRTADIFLIEGSLSAGDIDVIAATLLTDPITQRVVVGVEPKTNGSSLIEVHPLPGVMDPVAASAESAIREIAGLDAAVRTGVRYEIDGVSEADARIMAESLLANPVVQAIHFDPHHPESFPEGHRYTLRVNEVALCDLDDEALKLLSREAHLFLSLDEMREVRDHYRALGREPRDVELETLAQTWSEHCVHKTLKSNIRYEGEMPNAANRPGHVVNSDGSITITNLLKSTVAAATHELMADGIDWCLSVFVDNAGIIEFDDELAVCFKVETHNHPSALEPYGGAATGIGGCIRDIIGTGLAAKPIASTDIFCVANPTMTNEEVPAGCLHPRRILSRVVGGVRDYGNRMGIPTLNGGVWFDDRYVGNPLVYCGSVGVMPKDKVAGDPQPGDHIIVIGGRTGRDGIHGATFSSAELTDTHADEFSHAVQIGNAITEKKTLDAILRARDHASGCLFSAITDCGAGGFSSAVGEMGEQLGATVHLERAPLKYDGLSYTEIWISEAQERMVLAVPADKIERIAEICREEDVEWCDLGTFGTPNRELILNYAGTEVGRLSMEFLHEGIPTPTREAKWTMTSASSAPAIPADIDVTDTLLQLLAHPNIASKEWIIRQYDHEVQGQTVIKPITGPKPGGPSDAAVITPKLTSTRGLAMANGLATGMCADPYRMTLAAIDECVRNLVCVGADPERIAILDNFCWPSCEKPENLGSLVRAAEACYDGAKAYRTPFISGKDSLNNQFTTEDGRTIEIPPTLLISGFGIVNDVRQCITMDAKSAGNVLVVVGETSAALGGSHYAMVDGFESDDLPLVDLEKGPRTAKAIAELIAAGVVRSAHDCSEGGLLLAASEMAFAGGLGLELDLTNQPVTNENVDLAARCFAETPSRYLLEVSAADVDRLGEILGDLPWSTVGTFTARENVTLPEADVDVTLTDLSKAWRGTLDW